MKVNLVELCSDLAAFTFNAVEKALGGNSLKEWDKEEKVFKYTEEGQHVFDKHYDEVWNYLVSQGFENINE